MGGSMGEPGTAGQQLLGAWPHIEGRIPTRGGMASHCRCTDMENEQQDIGALFHSNSHVDHQASGNESGLNPTLEWSIRAQAQRQHLTATRIRLSELLPCSDHAESPCHARLGVPSRLVCWRCKERVCVERPIRRLRQAGTRKRQGPCLTGGAETCHRAGQGVVGSIPQHGRQTDKRRMA